MKILGIESSCDDSSLSLVQFRDEIFQVDHLDTISQNSIHAEFGGVVPELASRAHLDALVQLVRQLPTKTFSEISAIAVSDTPGLPGSLVVGRSAAATLSQIFSLPVLPVDHIQSHIFSVLLDRSFSAVPMPALVLTVSGGHSQIFLRTESDGKFQTQLVATTRDDAAGEALDKVARLLGWPYPGGRRLSQLAERGQPRADFALHFFHSPDGSDFSFSGIKSQVSTLLKKNPHLLDSEQNRADIARAFLDAAISTLFTTLSQNLQKFQPASLCLVGGVSANRQLRDRLTTARSERPRLREILRPSRPEFSTDNGAMIALTGLLHLLKKI